jgi:hypothetical protein
MKQVIDGKMYNTDTAEEIGSWSNNLGYGDFRSCSETLYRTEKGNYFVHGKGGAMSKYAESCGDSIGSGSEIIPMDRAEAFEWAQQHCGDEDVMEHFNDMIEEA